MRPWICSLVLLFASCPSATATPALWPSDSTANGIAITAVAGQHWDLDMVPDGSGGVIVVWSDTRTGGGDLYAQRFDAGGHAQWTTDGVPVCLAPGAQSQVRMIADGAGGAILVWTDRRGGAAADLYAQRIDATGSPQWSSDGVAVCTASGTQSVPLIVTDGAGGAIIGWVDARSGNDDLYVQRLDAAGQAQWSVGGQVLCNAPGAQFGLRMVAGSQGKLFTFWMDDRTGFSRRVSGQRLTAQGQILGVPNGDSLATALCGVYSLQAISDDHGGAIIAYTGCVVWHTTNPDNDIFTQRYRFDGSAAWGVSPKNIVQHSAYSQVPQIASDGAGGAVVIWQDHRHSGVLSTYAQSVDSAGAIRWTEHGAPVWKRGLSTGAAGSNDDVGTVFTEGDWHPRVWRLDENGQLAWAPGASTLGISATSSVSSRSVADGDGGQFVLWSTTTERGRLQRVDRHGLIGEPGPVITGFVDAPADEGGQATLAWTAHRLDAAPVLDIEEYRVMRSDGQGPWQLAATVPAAGAAGYQASVVAAIAPTFSRFRVEAIADGGVKIWASEVDSVATVDDIAPMAPVGLAGTYLSGAVHLSWSRNGEADLSDYRVYRGATADFVPSVVNRIATTSDTTTVDVTWPTSVYKVTASDTHGNESPVATLLPGELVAVSGDGSRGGLALSVAHPMRPGDRIRFRLPVEGPCELTLLDVTGRVVATFARGVRAAGDHELAWDDKGRAVGAGIYFLRLSAARSQVTRRIALLR